MRAVPAELRGFLTAFDPAIGRLFLAARAAVLAAAPQAHELIYDAYNAVTAAYSFSARLSEAFCHVAAYSGYVNLGFNRGAELPDPTRMFVGSGARIRHVRLTTPADLRAPALQALLRAAVAQGETLVGQVPVRATSTIRPTTGAKRRPRLHERRG